MKIEKVTILISNFEQTKTFYKDTLQFNMISITNQSATFKIGDSLLTLVKDLKGKNYYYHFAFNIHANLFFEAKEWLSKRVTLLREDEMDEIYFDGATQANSCYFEDPAGNIVEFIARRLTSPFSEQKRFSINNVLSIGEISLSTSQIKKIAKKLDKMGIIIRENDQLVETSLNFFGEYDDGAFILLGPIGRRWLFSSKTSIYSPVIIQTNKGIIDNIQ